MKTKDKNMKKLIVRWEAQFETEIEVEDNATEQEIMDAAADIDVESKENTQYISDTWSVMEITDRDTNIRLI